MQCWSKNPADVHGPVVAIWTCQPSGTRVPLCKPCLDGWLDNADDNPDLEPARLHWVVNPGQRWCIRHNWPAELCLGWPHQPEPEVGIIPLIATHTDDLAHGEVHTAGWCQLCNRAHLEAVLRFSRGAPPPDTRLNLFSLSPEVRDG